MKNNITLSAFGYSKYILTETGRLYKPAPSPKEIKKDNLNRFYIVNDNGQVERITLKKLYKKVFKKEFCIDNIQDLPNEQWKLIDNTDGKYKISNYGRVKSLCGYTVKILQSYKTEKGYLIVKINGKNKFIHRLVAFAFCENKYSNCKTEIHHIDGNRENNIFTNLEILSITEHHKRHFKKENIDNEQL